MISYDVHKLYQICISVKMMVLEDLLLKLIIDNTEFNTPKERIGSKYLDIRVFCQPHFFRIYRILVPLKIVQHRLKSSKNRKVIDVNLVPVFNFQE
jgi:hypothetical protein